MVFEIAHCLKNETDSTSILSCLLVRGGFYKGSYLVRAFRDEKIVLKKDEWPYLFAKKRAYKHKDGLLCFCFLCLWCKCGVCCFVFFCDFESLVFGFCLLCFVFVFACFR